MVAPSVSAGIREELQEIGCIVRAIENLYPPEGLTDFYTSERFKELWTKLRVWGLTEFQRVVFLDADMLVMQNMDELFLLEMQGHSLAACHACRCNPCRISNYPPDWSPENCYYTWRQRGDGLPPWFDPYLNSGLLVLNPDDSVYEAMAASVRAISDLAPYPFADQDFVNEFFKGSWLPLPYIYNALKSLSTQHRDVWRLEEIKNLHFILDKPWNRKPGQPVEWFDEQSYSFLDDLWWDRSGLRS